MDVLSWSGGHGFEPRSGRTWTKKTFQPLFFPHFRFLWCISLLKKNDNGSVMTRALYRTYWTLTADSFPTEAVLSLSQHKSRQGIQCIRVQIRRWFPLYIREDAFLQVLEYTSGLLKNVKSMLELTMFSIFYSIVSHVYFVIVCELLCFVHVCLSGAAL